MMGDDAIDRRSAIAAACMQCKAKKRPWHHHHSSQPMATSRCCCLSCAARVVSTLEQQRHPSIHGSMHALVHAFGSSTHASPSIRRDSIHASTTGQAGDKGAEEREPGRPSSMHAPPPFRACQPMQTKGDPIDQSV
jgi:hypothetical protein